MNVVDLHDGEGRRLLTVARIAELRGVTTAAVEKARQRGTLPEPVGHIDRRTPVWLEDDLVPIPAELRRLDRWVRHADKKPRRVADGQPATSTNPLTWSPFWQAVTSSVGDGLGFVLAGDGIVCIDLDHCLEDGEPTGLAVEILDRCPSTWIEVSPSATGLHIWGRATLAKGRRTPGLEIYGDGRMITVTQTPFRSAPPQLADLSEVVASL